MDYFAGGFRRLRAASDFLDAQKVTKEPLGGGSGWALRAHIRRPLEPHYGGRATGRFLNISGAQNLSGWSEFLPGHFVVADFVSLASSCRTKLAHSIAPPLQRKPASLGFALGAAFGGLFGWKISAGAVPLVRLGFFSQRSRCGIPHPPPSGAPSPKGEGRDNFKAFPFRPIPPVRGKCPKGTKGVGASAERSEADEVVGAAHWAARGLIWGRPLRKAPYGERNVPLKPSLR